MLCDKTLKLFFKSAKMAISQFNSRYNITTFLKKTNIIKNDRQKDLRKIASDAHVFPSISNPMLIVHMIQDDIVRFDYC